MCIDTHYSSPIVSQRGKNERLEKEAKYVFAKQINLFGRLGV